MEKIKFTTLDAIRGLAAIFIVIRHSGEFWGGNPFYNSFLAVDIFFLLSGFVIAHAYSQKLSDRTLSIKDFFALRIIRLYPLYFISVLFCIVVLMLNLIYNRPGDFTLAAALGVLFTLVFLPNIFQTLASAVQLFPINSVYWSLFYELLVNLMLAVFNRWLNVKIIIAILAIAASLILYFGVKDKSIDAGDSWGLGSIALGSARAFFGIFVGFYLYQARKKISIPALLKRTPLIPLVLICIALAMPKLGQVNWIYQLLCVFIFFPICILWSANTNQSSLFLKPMIILGALSYPAYVMHVPTTKLLNTFFNDEIRFYAPISGLLFLCIFLILCVYMEKNIENPARNFLKKRYFLKRPTKK